MGHMEVGLKRRAPTTGQVLSRLEAQLPPDHSHLWNQALRKRGQQPDLVLVGAAAPAVPGPGEEKDEVKTLAGKAVEQVIARD